MMRLAALFALLATPALAEVPRVVTDFGPVQSLVADVMGDLGQPEMLLPPGADPHDFQLRPSQAQALSEAGVIFWVGPELMPELEEALTTLAPQARIVPLLPQSPVTRAFEESEAGKAEAEEGGEHDHDHEHDHGHAHEAGGVDPHAWLDPRNAMAWLEHVAAVLSEADPGNAATYAANAKAAAQAIAALDADLAARLAPLADRPFVTNHDALGYVADRYSLALAGSIELGDAAPPSAAQLARVQALLEEKGVVCVFPEAGRDPRYIETLTENLPVRVGAAQDIEFIALEAGRGQYAVLLQTLGATLTECLAP